jgi:hypothetical protein
MRNTGVSAELFFANTKCPVRIGIEKDEKYFGIAEERINSTRLNLGDVINAAESLPYFVSL